MSMTKQPAKTVIKEVLVVLAIVISLLLIYHFIREIILIFVGVVLGVSMAPAVEFLHQHKVNRSISVILIYLLALAIFLVFIFLILPQLAQQVSNIAPEIQNIYRSFRSGVQNSSFLFIRQWIGHLPADLNSLFSTPSPTGEGAMNSLNLTLRVAQVILQILFELSIVLLVGFYWTMEGERAQYAFSLLFPAERREAVRATVQEIEARVGGFVRGQGLLALTIGAMVFIAYSIIGLPSVLSLAFAAALCESIPVFGPTLGAVPAVLLTLAANPTKLFWVIPVTVFLQLIENHFLAPQIMKRTVRVNPIVTILSITAFGYLLGFIGFLMAIPLAAIIQVILDRSVLRRDQTEVKKPEGRDSLSKLHLETQEFIQDVRKLVRDKEANATDIGVDHFEDSIESIATELDKLLKESLPPQEEVP